MKCRNESWCSIHQVFGVHDKSAVSKVLLIGGPKDGQVVHAHDDVHDLVLPVPPPEPIAFVERPGQVSPVSSGQYIYKISRVYLFGKWLRVGSGEPLTNEMAIGALLNTVAKVAIK